MLWTLVSVTATSNPATQAPELLYSLHQLAMWWMVGELKPTSCCKSTSAHLLHLLNNMFSGRQVLNEVGNRLHAETVTLSPSNVGCRYTSQLFTADRLHLANNATRWLWGTDLLCLLICLFFFQRVWITGSGKKKIKHIGDHALPQRGCGLGTPEGAEGGWATPGNTERGRQRQRAQATLHQTSSKHTFTSRHGRM
jgi:hypothetical protein